MTVGIRAETLQSPAKTLLGSVAPPVDVASLQPTIVNNVPRLMLVRARLSPSAKEKMVHVAFLLWWRASTLRQLTILTISV